MGIIGGLILGQAAVSANLVSKVALIIVALAGLGNFTVPDFSFQLAVAYYRIVLTLFAWMGGLLGLLSGVVSALAYLQVSALSRAGEPETRTVFYFSFGATLVGAIGMFWSGLSPWGPHAWWLLPIGYRRMPLWRLTSQ